MSLTASDLTQITDVMQGLMKGFATKSDLDGLATKADLDNLATKAEVKSIAAKMATKVDLDRMESRLVTAINLLERDSFSRLDQHEARIARLENAR